MGVGRITRKISAMNKRKYQSLVKRAVRAYRMETGEYDSIMDEAGTLLEWPDNLDGSDTQWDKFCHEVEEGCKVPLTPREQKMLDNRKRKEQIETAKAQLKYAQQLYDSLTIKGSTSR